MLMPDDVVVMLRLAADAIERLAPTSAQLDALAEAAEAFSPEVIDRRALGRVDPASLGYGVQLGWVAREQLIQPELG